jgi:hypothetical protein
VGVSVAPSGRHFDGFVRPTWSHVAWAGTLCNQFGVTLGEVYRTHDGRWGCTTTPGDGTLQRCAPSGGLVEIGTYATRDEAVRAVEDGLNAAYR